MDTIERIHQIDTKTLRILAGIGVKQVDQFLHLSSAAESRQWIFSQLGLSAADFDRLVEWALLSQIPGIQGVFAELLSSAGVQRLQDLAEADPGRLYNNIQQQLREKDESPRRVIPEMVEEWIQRANWLLRKNAPFKQIGTERRKMA